MITKHICGMTEGNVFTGVCDSVHGGGVAGWSRMMIKSIIISKENMGNIDGGPWSVCFLMLMQGLSCLDYDVNHL